MGQTIALPPALGFLSLLILSLLLCTNLERLSGKPPVPPPVSFRFVYALLAAAVLLFFAAGFLLAAPTVPWVVRLVPGTEAAVNTGTMFTFYSCSGTATSADCSSQNLVSIASSNNVPPLTGAAVTAPFVAASAQRIGVCCYVFSLILLLPAALFASASAYRLKLLLAHGTPAPTEGCASIFFPLATALSLLGLVCTIGTMSAAFDLAGPSINVLSNAYIPRAAGSPNAPSIEGMPGPVVGALAIVCSLLASALLLPLACCAPRLAALPGYGAGRRACGASGANPLAQAQAQLHGASQQGAYPLFAAQHAHAGAGDAKGAPGQLPPGWRQMQTEDGAAYYVDPAGVSHWEPPRV